VLIEKDGWTVRKDALLDQVQGDHDIVSISQRHQVSKHDKQLRQLLSELSKLLRRLRVFLNLENIEAHGFRSESDQIMPCA
jgi:hypothetical protein